MPFLRPELFKTERQENNRYYIKTCNIACADKGTNRDCCNQSNPRKSWKMCRTVSHVDEMQRPFFFFSFVGNYNKNISHLSACKPNDLVSFLESKSFRQTHSEWCKCAESSNHWINMLSLNRHPELKSTPSLGNSQDAEKPPTQASTFLLLAKATQLFL